MGTGTTSLAAIACSRNSIGVEINKEFRPLILDGQKSFLPTANELIASRILAHKAFVELRRSSNGNLKYVNKNHEFPVMTKQEIGICFYRVTDISIIGESQIIAKYEIY